MSNRCKLQKEYYKEHGNYKGSGKYNDEYVKWLEDELIKLRQSENIVLDSVSGSLKCKNCDSFDLRIEELTYYCKECHNVYYH